MRNRAVETARSRLRTFDRRLTAPGPASRLLLMSTLLAVVIGWRLATRDWTAVAERPAVLTDGLSIMSWWPTAMPAPVLVTLQVVGLLGVGLVLVRRCPRLGLVLAWSTYTVLCALWGSSGKVMHNDVLTVTAVVPLLFARLPARSDAQRPSVRWGWPPRAVLMLVATVYLLTGVQKLRHSGLDWVFGDNMTWIVRQGSSVHAPGLAELVIDRPWLAQALAGGALLLELTAPVWLALRRTRLLFAVAVLLMHGSIWLLLGIDYSAWILTVAAVTVPMAVGIGRQDGADVRAVAVLAR